MAVAGILGGFVAVLLVFVLEYMDNTLKTQDDVAKYLNLGTLGAIPVMESRQRRKK
jgi:capsular polysaccharide biosynthesis protein